MITNAVLALLKVVLDGISGLLPTGTITDLPDAVAFGTMIGEKAGPFNQILPIAEATTSAVIFLTVWMPAAMVYTVVFWIYKHLPFFGKG